MYNTMSRNVIGRRESNSELFGTLEAVIINLIYGYLIAENVDNMCHVGGSICGALFTLLYGPLYRLTK
jgi:membrane associated rhomboid family serine protease